MSNFKVYRRNVERGAEPIDWRALIGKLGLDAKIIAENLALERRTARPFRIKDPSWWLRIPFEWVVCYRDGKEWRSLRTRESFWDSIVSLPPLVREVHVFHGTGLHHKYYKRVFDFFRIEEWDIRAFSEDDREALWRELKRPMRQRIENEGKTSF